MTAHQRIVRVRRNYNQWVANQTLEDFALRFTAKRARRWSNFSVANTAIGAISFLALEAIGGSITLNYGFTNAVAAIVAVSALIFLTGLPISFYASKYGVDIDLLTRGAGFGYIGSTITSLIYASFTFIFFALEAAIMSLALELCFGIPLTLGYVISSLVVIPLVTHGITWISRLQLWTQPFWIVLHILPFAFIIFAEPGTFARWVAYPAAGEQTGAFNLVMFGTASMVCFSLVAQIGEQVDFLRFLPSRSSGSGLAWWIANLSAGAGWIIPGALKLLAGSFLAVLAVNHLVPVSHATEPTQMYLVAFQYVFSSPAAALAFTGIFVIISQVKINVTNAYAGSIAWSNFFSRLTHSHPGRVVWLVFNVAIALLLMELGIFHALERILGLYSIVAIGWVGALVSDLVINKPLGLSPPFIEFKRAHLYDINPVGVGAMLLATLGGLSATYGFLGATLQPLSAFFALAIAFVSAPLIALATRGRYYIARTPRHDWGGQKIVQCAICEHHFETEDMAHCPAYAGPICSLCCSLETRCGDCCKPHARLSDQFGQAVGRHLPDWVAKPLRSDLGHFASVLLLFAGIIGLVLLFVYFQVTLDSRVNATLLKSTLWTIFFILSIIAGIAAWLFVLADTSRNVAEEETRRQTELLMQEIEAHKRTDAKLQRAKEIAEAASNAKSRHVAGLSHELRTPLNAILGYARILERDPDVPARRSGAIKVMRRNAEHLSGMIDGLLDISKIEAGRFHLNRNEVPFAELLKQLADMFAIQAQAKGIAFDFQPADTLPAFVYTDESRLRQILINVLSNAIKFTDRGGVTFTVSYRSEVAKFEIKDTGIGIHQDDLQRIFRPFERSRNALAHQTAGTGLGLSITKLLTDIMGGEIRVASDVGKGTTFTIRMMLSEVPRPRTVQTPEDEICGYAGRRQIILVVDDNDTHRDMINELLTPIGFDVRTAASGRECLALLPDLRPDAVLLDISMPEMNGWEVAEHIRDVGDPRPAVIMLSALAPDKERDVRPDRAHHDYLMKPVDLRQLLEKLHTLLDIDWIYRDDNDSEAAMDDDGDGGQNQTPYQPTPEMIDELIQLGEIGRYRALQDRLGEIEKEGLRARRFVRSVRPYLEAVDLKRFVEALQALRSENA